MGFTLTWQFLDADTDLPIMGLPINIAHKLTNADCFGSVNYYPTTTQDTDSSGSVSQNFGGGMCGTDSIQVSSAGTNSYLGTLHKYTVAISSAQTKTYTIYVQPVTNQTTGGQVNPGTASQAGTFFSQISADISNFLGIAQADFEYILVFLMLILALVIIIVAVVAVKGGGLPWMK